VAQTVAAAGIAVGAESGNFSEVATQAAADAVASGEDPVAAAAAAVAAASSASSVGNADAGRVVFSMTVDGVNFLSADVSDDFAAKIQSAVAYAASGAAGVQVKPSDVDVMLSALGLVYVTVTPSADLTAVRNSLTNNQTAMSEAVVEEVNTLPGIARVMTGDEVTVSKVTAPSIEAVYLGANAAPHLDK
jgi:hypothetical protein